MASVSNNDINSVNNTDLVSGVMVCLHTLLADDTTYTHMTVMYYSYMYT